jgi:hypothetical protein
MTSWLVMAARHQHRGHTLLRQRTHMLSTSSVLCLLHSAALRRTDVCSQQTLVFSCFLQHASLALDIHSTKHCTYHLTWENQQVTFPHGTGTEGASWAHWLHDAAPCKCCRCQMLQQATAIVHV